MGLSRRRHRRDGEGSRSRLATSHSRPSNASYEGDMMPKQEDRGQGCSR
uniref:Uncharacterized protein n=1 Tax=Oryza rufipogon TaxID=4529 RepID=A0A0E0QD68_ORYRU